MQDQPGKSKIEGKLRGPYTRQWWYNAKIDISV